MLSYSSNILKTYQPFRRPFFQLKQNLQFISSSLYLYSYFNSKWPEPNKQHVNPPEAKPHASSSPPRQHANLPQPPAVSRNPTVTDPAPSPFVKSVVTRNPRNSSSASCHSSVLSVRSPRTSRPTSVSRDLPSLHSRKPRKPTLLVFSKIPTCAQSTPNVLPSCQRTFSLPAASVVNALKRFLLDLVFESVSVDTY